MWNLKSGRQVHGAFVICLTLGSAACSSSEGDASGSTAADTSIAGDDAQAPTDAGDTKADAAECTEGELGCLNPAVAKICLKGAWELADQCSPPLTCNQGYCSEPTTCTPKEIAGCATYDAQKQCSDDGKAWLPIPCEAGELCVEGVCKKTVCAPGVIECVGETKVRQCKPDGSGWQETKDCKSGAYCLGGTCVSLCEANLKVASNVGCEYWSVDLDNANDKSGAIFGNSTPQDTPHSVVVANPGIFDATVTWDLPAPYAVNFADNVVKAGTSREFKMPVMNVDGSSISTKAIHFTTDQPVVAYQFNPFNAEKAYSNDGSLLLPHNSLGTEYFAITRGSSPMVGLPGGVTEMFGLPSQNGYFTVAAVMPGETTVTVTLSGKGYVSKAPQTGLPIKAGQTVSFKLTQYQVLSLEGHSEGLFSIADLTGSRIKSTKVVAVWGGHEEAVIGYTKDNKYDSCCAEHLEEQLLPVSSWGKTYYLPKTKPRGVEPDEWLIMAALPGTKLKTTPSVPGLDGATLGPGQVAKAFTTESFKLEANGPVQVAQFLVSQQQTDDFTGDPTMLVHPSLEHLRSDYFILTPVGYKTNWVSVVRPKDLQVKHNGVAIAASAFSAIGDGAWELAYVEVKPGQQRFEAEAAFALSVYGYGPATAYGYPGGMTLK